MKNTQVIPISYSSFLDSSIINLRCSDSSRIFKVHEALLQSKGGAIYAAFSGTYKEGTERTYIFKETAEGILLRYIEWAYRDDYPHVLNPDKSTASKDTNLPCGGDEEWKIDANNPLLCHVKMYIFADTYLIAELKSLSFEKITKYLKEEGTLIKIDSQLAVIRMLDFASSNLLPDDDLLHWLGIYATWCLERLREQPAFHDIAGKLVMYIVRYARQSSTAPWELSMPISKFPMYEPKRVNKEG
ncbi:hypothetical protein LOZ12_006398 [Ophidiomyces ophidiicola]|uniref:Uncharacterized protein n=1 Tax=Ophidiomyces ophidiicola TaxID=1387563 RepID=A0ACB8URF2_9EURO|nr:hypothetical protein LOZ64_006526 [Ophidiomyces ophidiicola]KAI1906316.1 hypothetical protein LOZ61_006733 [Ophidiomyces ophidiicola]KAI1920480.1 hypothetical protein LOZ60_006568 [Ophidiomyces ophidiicola]KAI1934687.1 hypothetical protein LOZ62_006224 [Ophidiomyces ophidiicola]KAI1948036.1 hypothetical protein LOZ59_006514 [Ophidiomyces ophidiicola]